MTVKLNIEAFAQAKMFVKEGRILVDKKDAWHRDQPSTETENAYIEKHGYHEYGLWHLGIDKDKDENTKERYSFPYGDFKNVRLSAVLAAEKRAGQYKHLDIEDAIKELLSMIKNLA